MTSGIRLKKELGLEKLKEVRIARVIELPIKFYFVYYDSATSIPLNQNRILKNHRVATVLSGFKTSMGILRHLKMLPPMLIENWNGSYKDSFIILVDLAGDWLPQRKAKYTVKYVVEGICREDVDQLREVEEAQPEVSYRLDEKGTGFAVLDYTKKAPSKRNLWFFDVRSKHGNSGAFLQETLYDPQKDSLLLKFYVKPTSENRVKVMDLHSHHRWSNKYTVLVEFEEVWKTLGDEMMKKLAQKKNMMDRIRAIREILRKCTAKVHSNDMSFYWQGVWENADHLGYAIFPFTGKHGKGIWSRKHSGEEPTKDENGVVRFLPNPDAGESPAIYITKHILEVMRVIPFNVDTMAKKLRMLKRDETVEAE